MKNTLVCIALAAGALTTPALSFAQSNGALTRAEVRADLVRVEQAGYNPARSNDNNYPADIQAAEAKIAAQGSRSQDTQAVVGNTHTHATPRRLDVTTAMQSNCIGPVDFCNTYFGG